MTASRQPMPTRTVTITGTLVRLRQLARRLGVQVTEYPRTGTPCLHVEVPAACAILSAHARANGAVVAHPWDSTDELPHVVYSSHGEFARVLRGWTADIAEATMASNSLARCRAIRVALDTDRSIVVRIPA